MFNLRSFDTRLKNWADFRNSLEQSTDPLNDVISYYNLAPLVSINVDPWDRSVWPGPWELINENQYCSFCKILGMCYTLQLTERFKDCNFEIHIASDNKNSSCCYYLLVDNEMVVGYNEGSVCKDSLPPTLYSQRIYTMEAL
tara:strand:- start:1128 stop:1553 length:426 start_codon:yes stop_codon:yes gene_type:complete